MKQYRNAERTKKWIRKAFSELIAEKKSIDKVTVKELAERADITKTTFYYHYDDIYAVAEEFENELVTELNKTLETINRDNPEDYSEYLRQALTFVKENEESYRLVVNATDLSIFSGKLKNSFSKAIVAQASGWGFSPDYEKRSVQVYFLVSGLVDTIIRYLRGNFASSLDTVGDVLIEAIEKLRTK